jgi:dolichyl-diphosphooligosaccharide--protein glycosyltransferase
LQTTEYFKSGFQYQENNNTYTFLGDLDSYYYLRQARNLEEKGMVCDEITEGKCRDTYLLAPLGSSAGASMHPYGILYTYKILHTFNSKINLMQASFYLPIILAMIAAVAAFFIGRKLMNNTAGFFAAMFIALNPLFISRTAGSDTDIWNIMFPLLIIWVILEVFDSKKIWKKITLTALAGLLLGAFSFAWVGWWYIFDFILVSLIGYLVFEVIKEYIKNKKITKLATKEIKDIGIIIGVLIISTIIFVSLFTNWSIFVGAFTSPLHLQGNLKAAAHADLWPNVFTTVAELNEANIPTIIGQITSGMNILFPLALLGILFTLVKRKPDLKEYLIIGASVIVYFALISTSAMNMNPIVYLSILMIPVAIVVLMLLREKESTVDVKMAFLLTIWFVGMIYASIKGVRFILLLIPAFSIAVAVAIGYIYQYFDRIFNQDLKIQEILSKVAAFLLLCLILIAPIQIGISAGKSYMPSMTAGWWDSLSKIRQESKPDAIINSWWDFGHWFKYVANRRVSLDGVSQNHPNAHWLGLALQTNDANKSVAILRMLDCGSNNAFVEIDKKNNDTEISENIVSEIIIMSKENAKKDLLAKGYSDKETETILGYTHCTPPEDYFITSEDMVGKAGVWAHFGLWNFDKAFVVNNVKPLSFDEGVQLLKKQFNYTTEESEKIYYDVQALQTDREMNDWISPWPSYASSMMTCFNVSELILCDLGIGIGGNTQQNYVLQRAMINLTNPKTSQVLIGVYDRTNNAKIGESLAAFDQVIIAGKELKKYQIDNATIGLSMLLDVQENNNVTTYRALVSDPALIDSTFTKLFFLDGKYMSQFEKFSDMTDITGTRIIIWKIKW